MSNFKIEWLARFELHPKTWQQEVKIHTTRLPFIDPTESRALIFALFGRVPELLKRRKEPSTENLAEAYGWCCYSLWQCEAAMPAFPENYAHYLLKQLVEPVARRDKQAILLADLITARTGKFDGECGFNKLKLASPEIVRDSERLMLKGGYDAYLNAQVKYDEFLEGLIRSEEFHVDWSEMKQGFPHKTRTRAIIHRSLLPERNWEQGGGAKFGSPNELFQSLFDLFCWKYYLWGMKADKPLLMKPSVVFTPLGTQIFIPGYLSFDPKRDLNFGKIARLHRARGVTRQGHAFAASRKHQIQLRQKAATANREAKRLGLKGDHRYEHIAKKLALPLESDFRKIRKLLED